ncbi:MAG: hypothetical protein FVQ77_09385 [Cytophagales bacterium]|nr:hypothetical protein [Cytophagales bacterium]
MKKLVKSSLIIIISILSFNIVFAQNEFTQKDREKMEELGNTMVELRITMEKLMVTMEQMEKLFNQRLQQMEKRIDQRFEQMEKRIDQRFQQIEKRIDSNQTFMLWGFGILFGGIALILFRKEIKGIQGIRK